MGPGRFPFRAAGGALTSLDATHVQFPTGDQWGRCLAYLTLSPIYVLVSYVSVSVARRELTVPVVLLGQLLNELLNAGLKLLFRAARPLGSIGPGYGMPSGHSQFFGFFATYWSLHLTRR